MRRTAGTGAALTLALLVGGTGVAVAAWSSGATADLPVASVKYVVNTPTLSNVTCGGVLTKYLTGVRVNWAAVDQKAVQYQVLRGVTVVSTQADPNSEGTAMLYNDVISGTGTTSITYTVTVSYPAPGATQTSASATVTTAAC